MANGSQQPPLLSQPKKSAWLWIVLGAVSVIVLIFALYYYYSAYAPTDYGPTGSVSTEEKNLSALEEGLQTESLDGLDAELGDIEKELSK